MLVCGFTSFSSSSVSDNLFSKKRKRLYNFLYQHYLSPNFDDIVIYVYILSRFHDLHTNLELKPAESPVFSSPAPAKKRASLGGCGATTLLERGWGIHASSSTRNVIIYSYIRNGSGNYCHLRGSDPKCM